MNDAFQKNEQNSFVFVILKLQFFFILIKKMLILDMNNVISSLLVSVLSISLSLLSTRAIAQPNETPRVSVENVDAKELILKLRDQRYHFNKSLIKSESFKLAQLPKAEYIFKNRTEAAIHYNDVTYQISNGKVVKVNDFEFSEEALANITEKLLYLDEIQHACTENANREYGLTYRSLRKIQQIDRDFFSSLSILTVTLKDINRYVDNRNANSSIHLKLKKMRSPNVALIAYK